MVSLLLGAFLVLLAAPAAYGQAAEGGAGGISREAQQPRAQPFSIPRVVPDRTQRAPEGAAAFNFPVTDFRVTGATILTESDLQALLEPFKSPESNFIRLQEAALAITNAYAKAGYSLSFAMVPEQAVRGGTVLIQVLEGYVDQVDVELQEGRDRKSVV